jgi:hypothetical protein
MSTARIGGCQADPENKLLQHFPVRRLEAEAIRTPSGGGRNAQ